MARPYQALERALYDLGEPPSAEPARPQLRVVPRHGQPGPRGPFRESVRRIDLSLATRRLSADELEVIRTHYIRRVRRLPRRDREPIIRKLMEIL